MNRIFGLPVLGLCAVLAVPASQAATLVYEYDFEYTNGTPPSGPAPWLVATFDDHNSPGLVTLTIDASGLSGDEVVDSIYFNLDPALDASDLSLSYVGGSSTGPAAKATILGNDCCKAGSDGRFDLQMDFPSGQGFDAGETVVYDISLAGLTASSFDFLSASSGGSEGLYTAAHIQNTIDYGTGSGWISGEGIVSPVPVPAAAWLFGSGLLALGGLARRRNC